MVWVTWLWSYILPTASLIARNEGHMSLLQSCFKLKWLYIAGLPKRLAVVPARNKFDIELLSVSQKVTKYTKEPERLMSDKFAIIIWNGKKSLIGKSFSIFLSMSMLNAVVAPSLQGRGALNFLNFPIKGV